MINRRAVIALCSQAWSMPPDDIEQRIETGSITLQQLVTQAKVQILTAPLTGQALNKLAFPAMETAMRRTRQDKENDATFESFKRMRRSTQE